MAFALGDAFKTSSRRSESLPNARWLALKLHFRQRPRGKLNVRV